MNSFELIDKLESQHLLTKEEYIALLHQRDNAVREYLFSKARAFREKYYGKDVFVRGLIEISNYCKNDCLYCGIRKSNLNVARYRLSKEQIGQCCDVGYELGFRTFVLQGGEDLTYSDAEVCEIVSNIKETHPDCAVTLSIGERSREAYQAFFDAGADRYLLRHEAANAELYARLHPQRMSLENRKQCLWNLKEIGYQVGTGFMVGAPFQTYEHIAEDLAFIADLQPQMVGIGPFIPHHETPFANQPGGTTELTVFLLAVLRLMLPKVLLPATTALGTVSAASRNDAVLAGANVFMPNLSPLDVREKYMIYDNKAATGEEAAESLQQLKKRMSEIGYQVVVSRGDCAK